MSSSTLQIPTTLTSPPSQTATLITDALYRAVLAIDTNNPTLFASAFTTHATPSFTMNDTTHTGYDAIKANVFDSVGPLDTTHFLSNVRVNLGQETETEKEKEVREAKLTASALAYHYHAGEGVDVGKTERLVSGSLYEVDVVKEEEEGDGEWRVRDWRMKIVWLEGDMAVITG